jgi:uncharacterized membrane protein
MADKTMFVFMGVYSDYELAKADLEIVRQLHHAGVIGTYDAGLARKDANGDVKVDKWEKPTQHGAWTGLAAGAVIGLLFPPSILVMGGTGAGIGALVGHFGKGLSRADIKDLGEALDEGEAALIVIGHDRMADELEKAGIKAQKHIEKAMTVDESELESQLSEAQKES